MGARQQDHNSALKGASVIVLKRDAVLIVERARGPFAGLWSFPGGRCEAGEEPETTARRELLEETGVGVGDLVRLGEFQPAPHQTPLMLTVFAARAGKGEPHAAADAVKAEFVPLYAVLERKMTPAAAGWIARAIAALAGEALP
jgi:8-oxo-dGTP diphosphatase